MKLRTKINEIEEKPKEPKKPKKKKEKYKKSANFDRTGKYTRNNVKMPLNRLEYRMISNCKALTLCIDDESIPISDSWIEIVVTLISFIFDKYKDTILDILADNEICTSNLIVSQVYGKYSFDGKLYKVLKIPNTNYYIESTFSEADIFSAIWGSIKALKLDPKDISFFLINPDIEEKERLDDLAASKILNITEIKNEKAHLKRISYKEKFIKAHRLDSVLFLVIMEIVSEYGEDILQKLCDIKCGTGIIHAVDECILYQRIPNTEYSVYTDLDNNSIVEFLQKAFDKLNIDIDSLKLYYSVTEK